MCSLLPVVDWRARGQPAAEVKEGRLRLGSLPPWSLPLSTWSPNEPMLQSKWSRKKKAKVVLSRDRCQLDLQPAACLVWWQRTPPLPPWCLSFLKWFSSSGWWQGSKESVSARHSAGGQAPGKPYLVVLQIFKDLKQGSCRARYSQNLALFHSSCFLTGRVTR